jgi:hypothetical protein
MKVFGMEKSSKRGKIPQQDWPSIISRYEAGETLASIARTYDCSPPAISYIVSRTRARSLPNEAAPQKLEGLAAIEPQLVKTGSESTTTDMADGELMHSSDPADENKRAAAHVADVSDRAERRLFADPMPSVSAIPQGEPKDHRAAAQMADASGNGHVGDRRITDSEAKTGNGSTRPTASSGSQPAGETRRTLHLPLPQGNGAVHSPAHNTPNSDHAADPRPSTGQAAQSELALQPRPTEQAPASPPVGVRNPAGIGDSPNKARDGGAFIDHALRERISDDIAAFLAAFDAALDHDTAESRIGLREATDRLLRAGARTRIELERLEARLPLPARDGGQRPFPAPRPR